MLIWLTVLPMDEEGEGRAVDMDLGRDCWGKSRWERRLGMCGAGGTSMELDSQCGSEHL